MNQTRRDFLWTAGATTAAVAALQQVKGVYWAGEPAADTGWQPGIETQLRSACLVCPGHCGIHGRMVDGRLVRISGNPLHPVSRGGICPRGIAGVQTLYHPERIASPLQRVGARGEGSWRKIERADAIGLMVDRLRGLRAARQPEKLAVVAGYCEGTMQALWHQFFRAFGSPNYVADDYNDGTDALMAVMHGIPQRPAYDLERAGLVLSFGAPLFEAWWSPLQAYVAFGGAPGMPAPAQRPRVIQVDTRFSRTAAWAHEWVGIKPGTFGVLALGIAYVLIREQLVDADFLARHVSGFEDRLDGAGRLQEGYRSLVLRGYRTEEVSASTGVPVERIVGLAKTFAEKRPALALCGSDVMLGADGLLDGLAVHSLNVLMGNINRAGGVMFANEAPLEPLAAPAIDQVARAGLARKPLVGDPPPFGTGDQPRRFAEAVAGNQGAAVDTLLLYYANPLASSPYADAWRTALGRVPFIVSFSPFLDETTRQADLVVPDLLPYERWQDAPSPASYPYPVWSVVRPLVEPHSGGTHTGDALMTVAQRLGGSIARSLPYADMEAVLKARARGLFAARRGMNFGDQFDRTHYGQMEERGWWLAEHVDFDQFWDGLVERGGWTDLFRDDTDPAGLARTPDGRIDLLPLRLQRALEREGRGRKAYVRVSQSETQPAAEFPLRLLPYRISTLASGTVALQAWVAEQPTIFAGRYWVPWVEVHPQTAVDLGLGDGTLVRVRSARGAYRARVKIFPGIAPETVAAPYGLRHPDGELANPLQLLQGLTDPLTGMPSWSGTFVRLERA
ncbi:MAG: molybdopterin-dependent oxidoreductase [Gemmatimonadetes bacterium]|nr:molybdopterin-dependent oxidoreductase [Gemmatimonadota bacterium]